MDYSNLMLQDCLHAYLERFPSDRSGLTHLLGQLAAGDKMNDRRNFNGHITGSGIVLSPDKSKVLMIYHKSFQRWLQPGGHWESDDEATPLIAAQREVQEETGVRLARVCPLPGYDELIPVHIDSHQVPARPHKGEPSHWHHDFRYVFVAANERLHHQAAEVSDAIWVPLDDPRTQAVANTLDRLVLLSV